jgi:type I restriction enzyme S subunit
VINEPKSGYLCPAGYKQTEVGAIPEDWEFVTIGSIVTDFRGGAPFKPSDFTKSGFKVLPKGGVGRTGWLKIENSDLQYCSMEYAMTHLRNQVDESFTIVVLRDLVPSGPSIGLMVQIRGRELFVLAQGVYGFKVNQANVPGYLVQLSNTWWYRKLANSIMVGSTQVHITNTALKLAKIPLPPKAEQEAIAEALSDADALIESLEQLITKKRQIKQGAMQELLTGKKRLPGFSGEWEFKRLGDVADPNQKWSFTGGPFGSNLKSSDYIDDGVRIIQLQNIGDGEFYNDSAVFTSLEKANELLSCNIYPGEIILSKMGDPVARACIIPSHHERYLMCSDGIRLKVDPKRFNTYFIYISINAPDFRTRAENAGTGSTRKRIGLTELRNLELLCPELPEQTAIATILSDMDAEIATLETKLAKSRSIKQGMMHNLLTGKIRLL